MCLNAIGLFTQISSSVCLLSFPVIIYIYWLSLFTYLPPNFHLQVYSLPWPQLRVFALLVHTKKCFPKKKMLSWNSCFWKGRSAFQFWLLGIRWVAFPEPQFLHTSNSCNKEPNWEFLGSLVVRTVFSLPWAQVQSLVGELRLPTLHIVAKK